MARYVHNQTNFTAGELTPRMKGRGDVARYQNGADTIENGVVVVHGGVLRRDGTRYLATAKLGGARKARLIRYVFNVEHAYVLEVGHQYVRAYEASTGGAILNSLGAVLELASPYTEDQLAAITTKQTADALRLYHPDVAPYELRRLSATNWTLLPVRFIVQPFAEIGHLPDVKLNIDNPAIGTGRTFTTAPVTPPLAPTSVVATALNGGARVTFVQPDNGGAQIDHYTVTASPGGASIVGYGSPITLPGLSNGTTYTLTVSAHNKAGDGPASAPSNSVTPNISAPASTITASVTPSPFAQTVDNSLQVINGPTASGSAGVAPYTVHWSIVSADSGIKLTATTGAQAKFTSSGFNRTNYATLRATVTDANSAVGIFDVNVAITHKVPVGDRNTNV
jgi:hypothetical protein